MQVQNAIELIRMEYAELPELRLTFWQAQRLWNLSTDLCERALMSLTGSGFLVRTGEGAYVRRGDRLVRDDVFPGWTGAENTTNQITAPIA
jgi:hypothetical protein